MLGKGKHDFSFVFFKPGEQTTKRRVSANCKLLVLGAQCSIITSPVRVFLKNMYVRSLARCNGNVENESHSVVNTSKGKQPEIGNTFH